METPLLTSQLPGRTLVTETATYLYCSGTSYLGMARNEEFQAILQACFATYGTNYSSSRLSNVQLKIFSETEAYLSTWTGAEAALVVSSGLIAGQLIVKTFADTGTFIYGPRTHPALWRTPIDCYQGDYTNWAKEVPEKVRTATSKEVVILTNSLDALWVQTYSFDWITKLPGDKKITIIIDDSHGFGLTGKNGAGVYTQLPELPAHVQVAVISSFGKALGIPGGVILGNVSLIENLKKSAFFGGGSPPVPAYLAAFLQAENIYQQAREKLQENITQFTNNVQQPALFQSFTRYPVFYTRQNSLYAWLLEQQILISHFAYPTPADPPITRIILNSLHTKADIEVLTHQVNAFCASANISY
ncbi:aminotransferase class I/II-fold pyridoxal phosphate-dependent enzyme [Adhaeribacter radiodurans]|uniref:Aminotransferase class I/II-fold pyridoxal phosphate-dependent enzyme n=1 Tax=Adhaeribacter radiodurans TaxID=2745197 RepID=A0A7L7LBT0_9BACT|nr:aminotransferase class I/II-fold pyridoxal phosphate-dependent enzyme [Adhaeribacter radiodurans]QMU29995.1 aminotransferase class I/II-fold pyridoxal phosphate-dependent enzyme [Adhaeribacter radiodurans]